MSNTDQEQQPPQTEQGEQQVAVDSSPPPSKGIKRHISLDNLDSAAADVKEQKKDEEVGTTETTMNGHEQHKEMTTNGHEQHKETTTNGHEQHKETDNVLEKGTIIFSYKPRLAVDEASSLDDVQLFHVILVPDQTEDEGKSDGVVVHKTRLIKIGKKKLPNIEAKERFWAYVDKAEEDITDIEPKLEGATYETATVGTRTIKADRIAGKGKYVIASKPEDRRTNIGYVLEAPSELGPVQMAFNIIKEASYSVAIKNPKKSSPPQFGLANSQKADFPTELQAKFGQLQWIQLEPAFLDIVGSEMVWIGAADNIEASLGEIGKELVDQITEEGEQTAREVMKEIHLDPKEHPAQPLVDGQWPKSGQEEQLPLVEKKDKPEPEVEEVKE